MKKFFFLFAVALLTLAGCSKPDADIDDGLPPFELSSNDLAFYASGGTKYVWVVENRKNIKWEVVASSDYDWLTMSIDGTDITFKVYQNTSAYMRGAEFRVVCGSYSETLTIKQSGKTDSNDEESDESGIKIDEADKSIFFDANANQQTISFYAAQNWTASIIGDDDDENEDYEWCSISATSGDAGQSSIEIAVTDNYKTENRSVSIEIKSGAITETIVVTQERKISLILSEIFLDIIDPAGGEITVEVIPGVRINRYFTYNNNVNPETWIHPSGETHTETTTQYKFTIDPYYYIGEEIRPQRMGGVLFSLGELEEGIAIYQNCADAPAITASTKSVDLTYVEQAFTIEINHNVDITYEISADGRSWLSYHSNESTSKTTDKFVFSATRYDGDDDRSATITFTDRTNYATEIVKVTQHGLYGFSNIPEDMSAAFPDPNFRNYVLSKFDSNGDGILSGEEALAVTSMDVSSKKLVTLDGIQYFPNLEYLDCSTNNLTDLRLSYNTKLITLRCTYNKLILFSVNGCTALESLLYLAGNEDTLQTIDISGTALKSFDCSGSISSKGQLTSLIIRGCSKLETLSCDSRRLKSLDISGCIALKSLECYYSELQSLDVSNCGTLERLECYGSYLKSLNVSGCTSLKTLNCMANKSMTFLNVSGCTALTWLDCYNCALTSLDVSGLTKLSHLSCYGNNLTSLNATGCAALSTLDCDRNSLTSLNLTKCSSLTKLSCYSNQLTSLDVSYTNLGCNPGSCIIDCHDNPLESLYLKTGWEIIYITYGRNSDYIPDQTEIIFVD